MHDDGEGLKVDISNKCSACSFPIYVLERLKQGKGGSYRHLGLKELKVDKRQKGNDRVTLYVEGTRCRRTITSLLREYVEEISVKP